MGNNSGAERLRRITQDSHNDNLFSFGALRFECHINYNKVKRNRMPYFIDFIFFSEIFSSPSLDIL